MMLEKENRKIKVDTFRELRSVLWYYLTSHHPKGNATTITNVSFCPFWSGVSFKHSFCFSNCRKFPTFGFH